MKKPLSVPAAIDFYLTSRRWLGFALTQEGWLLARTPDAVPSPAWHGEILAARMAKIERGEAEFLTVPELKERLQNPTR